MKLIRSLFIIIFTIFLNTVQASVQTGNYAPEFTLTDSYGNQISLNDFRGKIVVLEWTNHDCPFVAKHYSSGNMQNTQKTAQDSAVIWVSIISSAPGTQGHVTKKEANDLTKSRNATPSHVLFDEEGIVGRLYDAKTTPHMYVINSKGLLKYQGAIDDAGGRGFIFKDLLKADNYVLNALNATLRNKQIKDPTTKPYGCSIKYKS
jgi:peroxiredoxin